MISKDIAAAMNDIGDRFLDDILLEELSAVERQNVIDLDIDPKEFPLGKRTKHSKGRLGRKAVAVIIAASLVFVFGIAAYAGGVITSPISIFRNKKTENAAIDSIGTDDANGMLPSDVGHTDQLIDNSGNWLDFIDISSLVISSGLDALNGPVKEEAPQMIWKLHKANYRSGNSSAGNAIVEYNGCTGFGINNYNKSFDTQQEAVEYIGHRSLGEQYFPFDNCKTTVSVCGDYWWKGKGETELPDSPESFSINSIELISEGTNNDINVRLFTNILLSGSPNPGLVGFFGLPDDGSNTTKLFTTPAGYNGTKISSVYGKMSTCNINGYIVKDGCVCYIFISCPWKSRTQAEDIFNTWAEHF